MKKFITICLAFAAFTFSATAQEASNAPKASYRSGKAVVTVWENEKKGEHGKYTEKNFKVEKIYKKDDKWESTNYFSLEELMQLRAAIDKAISKEAVVVEEGMK